MPAIAAAARGRPALAPPGFDAAAAPRMGPVPSLGQHTDAILAELGLSEADIGALRALQVL